MSANKTPQIHTQGNSKYLPKHVCFAGTVSERERAPRSSAQGQHKRSVPCAHQVLVPPRLPPLPASRIPHGVYTRQVPRPDAQGMAAPPPPPSPRPPLPRRHCLHRHRPPHRPIAHSLPPPAHHVYHFAIAINTSVTIITITAITSTTATERVKSFPTTAPQGLLLDCH